MNIICKFYRNRIIPLFDKFDQWYSKNVVQLMKIWLYGLVWPIYIFASIIVIALAIKKFHPIVAQGYTILSSGIMIIVTMTLQEIIDSKKISKK